jgi:ubiquinone/menaquinone biosynthesis C-methylase UbiE
MNLTKTETSEPPSHDEEYPNNTPENAQKYLLSSFENTYYLGYRDIPALLKKYAKGKKAIDYGCGTGRSTRFLASLGFETLGVDFSKEMLTQALNVDSSSHYLLIKSAQIPVLDKSYDVAFSCFVFLTVPSKNELIAILKEIHRCLKDDGVFIITTGSEKLYSHDWLSYNVNYPENKRLNSGAVAKIQLKDLGLDFINYFWTDADYEEIFQLTDFEVVKKHYPLGNSNDKKNWISETKHSPYVLYVLRKTDQNRPKPKKILAEKKHPN